MSKFEIICGPMFAGKTTTLINKVSEYVKQNISVVVLKPNIDDRYGKNNISSHDGVDLEKITGLKPITVQTNIKEFNCTEDIVFIDEIQFFDFADSLTLQLLNQNKHVVAVGLDLTSFGTSFGKMGILIAMADKITKLSAKCQQCNLKANFTYRKSSNNVDGIWVGGAESYEPRCYNCWQSKS